MHYKALLLDADGVTVNSPEPFSRMYAREHGFDPDSIEPFFKGGFQLALRGKADIKDLIRQHANIWRWHGDPQILLNQWFEAENHPNQELLRLIAHYRQRGLPVFLATNQEKHRIAYLRQTMFAGVFDDILASAEIGHTKREPAYWAAVYQKIEKQVPGITPQEVIYFDDSQREVDTARMAGISAYLYTGPSQITKLLA